MNPPRASPPHWGLLPAAGATLTITMGMHQTSGLFVEPVHADTRVHIASIGFALAVANWCGEPPASSTPAA